MLRDLDCKNAKRREKAYKLADSHGLYLYVTPKGHRSWRWNHRFRGKAATRTLGGYPEVSLADARIARAELDKLRRTGVDPAQASKQAVIAEAHAEAAKFEAVARSWYAQQKPHWMFTHAANVLRGLEREVFPHFGHLPITQIRAPMVLAALKPIEERGAVDRAHRTRQFISSIFQFAIASDQTEHDPAAKLKDALQKKKNGHRPALRTIEEARDDLVDFRTGRLDPAIDAIAARICKARSAVVRALARLKEHGFINWIRRSEPVENNGAGPQVRQISNAYGFGMPTEAAAWVDRSQGNDPLPDDEVARREMHVAELKAMLSQASLVEVVDYHTDDPILAGILKRMSSGPFLD